MTDSSNRDTPSQPNPGKRPADSHAAASDASEGALIVPESGSRLRRWLGTRRKGDASRGETLLYAFGNIEGGIANQFWVILQQIMIVAMHVNPLMIGLAVGIKSMWDSVTDPIMAYITDNTRSRWGRRRPYILVGGVSRMALLVLIILLFPAGSALLTNQYLEKDDRIKEAAGTVAEVEATLVAAHKQITNPENVEPAMRLDPDEIRAAVTDAMGSMEELSVGLPDTLAQFVKAVDDRRRLLESLQDEAKGGASSALIEREQAALTKAEASLDNAREIGDRQDSLRKVGVFLLRALDGDVELAESEVISRILAQLETREGERRTARAKSTQQQRPGLISQISAGFHAFMDPANADQRKIISFFLIAMLLFTTLTTVQSVPYFALGIELSPSYDGRTQVAVYRSIMDKVMGLVSVWVPAFCFLLWFNNALEGLLWVTIFAAAIGIPSTVLMVVFTRERTRISTKKKRMGLFKSFFITFESKDFWRVFLLYQIIGITWGVFMQFGNFLNVYWVMGSALKGFALAGLVQTVAWVVTFTVLPIINWACQRYQKHQVLQVAVVLMAIGAVLQWWTVTPKNPYLQLVLPFFTGVGISCFYVVMATLLADVTDADELRTGERREGMFSAVMSFTGKMVASLTPVIAGAMLVVAGLKPELEFNQTEQTITNMRLLYSFVPGVLMLIATFLLWKYPLNRQKMAEIKAELKRRHDAEDAEGAAQ